MTNLDALTDFISKDKLIGELPFLSESSKNSDRYSSSIADELLNKTVYEITIIVKIIQGHLPLSVLGKMLVKQKFLQKAIQ